MRRRITSGVACLAALTLTVAACGGDDDGGGSGELEKSACAPITDGGAKGETLSVWIMEGTNPDATPFFKEVSAKFEQQTGAKLDVQFVAWADAQTKFNNAIGGGTTPDVAETGTTWTPGFADAGALTDIDACVDEAGVRDDLVDSLEEAGTYDDSLYGMPWYAGVRSVVYRTDVFKKAGIEPPTTWDELVDVGEKLKKAEPDMLPFPVAGDSEYGADPFIWGAGGEIATEEDGQWTSEVDSPEAQKGIEFYTGLATEHDFSSAAAQTWDETGLSDAFARGEASMMIAGSWTPGALVEQNPDLKGKIGAFPIPGPEGDMSPSFVGGSHLSVFNTAENPDLAWTFVQMMTTGEFAQKWGDQTGYFPGTESLLDKVIQENDPLVAPFAKQMVEGGASVPVTPLYEKIQGKSTIPAMVQSILTGKASVDEAASSAADEMNTVFQGG
ncbi:sugar ABC transporter substrate-binding protein [Solicola gregarius]|uniref:Sugar ABC transporter substrate-binding protein n=1 Tax=Solicola gregarius TaxID=2908642 RepID=A0AA46YJG7_9ACTN|nr:sugar ABC transporter substrate-binding protein [Solicola gregarius]UYM03461.1 sugar ABC transporter substrate-binding protein [Solicola gregarius]